MVKDKPWLKLEYLKFEHFWTELHILYGTLPAQFKLMRIESLLTESILKKKKQLQAFSSYKIEVV